MKNWNPAKDAYENQQFNPSLGRSGFGNDDGRGMLFVNGIAPEINERAFKNLFEKCGKVIYSKFLPPKGQGSLHKCGFIHYGSIPEAQSAIRELNGCNLGGFKLKVERAWPRQKHSSNKFKNFVENCDKGPLIDADVERIMKKADDKFQGGGDAAVHRKPKSPHTSSFKKDVQASADVSEFNENENKRPSKSNSVGSGSNSSSVGNKPSQGNVENECDNPSKKSVKKPCNVCGVLATQYCSYCRFVYYCSQDCQRKDWREHKSNCKKLAAEKANEMSFDADEAMYCVDEAFCNGVAKLMQKAVDEETSGGSPMAETSSMEIAGKCEISNFPPNFKKGSKISLLVIDVDATLSFIVCQQAEQSCLKSLDKLQQNLNRQFKAKPPALLVAPAVGDCCAAKFSEDNQWYRGRICSICSNNQAIVQFVDYGNSECIDCNKIMSLDKEFCKFPAFSMLCKLAGCGVDESWTEEQSTFLIDQLQESNMLVDVECVEIVGQVLIAQFWCNNVWINEKMKSLSPIKAAEKIGHSGSTRQSKRVSPLSPLNTKTLASKNASPLNNSKNSPQEALMKPSPLQSTNRFASVKVPDGIFTVFVSHVDSPNSFYCQVVADDFLEVHNYLPRLTQLFSSQSNRRRYEPAVGDVCAALFSEDNQWYRAKVVKIQNATMCQVFYVDFGNTANISMKNLQPLPQEFHALPFQAFKASLSDCHPMNGRWSEDAINVLKNSLNATAQARKCSQTAGNEISLLLFVDESRTYNEHLVSLGFACKGRPGDDIVLPQRAQQRLPACTSLSQFQPPMNEEVTLVISALHKPGYFYCYVDNENAALIKSNSIELAKQCSNKKPLSRAMIKEGALCAAYFEKRQEWCRVSLINVKEALVQVKALDYGLTAWLLHNEVRVLPAQFAFPSMTALPCKLADVKPVADTWSDDFTNTIYNFLDKKLKAVFLEEVDGDYVVKVPDVTNMLILQGCAKYC